MKGQNVMRSVSVPRQQQAAEMVVKLEEGVAGVEALKGPAGEKAGKFFIGAEVAYRQTKPKEDGSQWIQCNITSVTGDGNKKWFVLIHPSLRYKQLTIIDTRYRTQSPMRMGNLDRFTRPVRVLLLPFQALMRYYQTFP